MGQCGWDNESILQWFLGKPGVDALYAVDATTLVYADLYHQLRILVHLFPPMTS